MESDARVSGAWNADTCSGKTRLSSRCAPCACRIHNSASAAQPEARCRRFENYLAERFRAHGFPSPPSLLFTRRSVARGGLLRSLQIFPSTRPGSRAFLSLLAHARTHAHARPIDASTCPPPRARFHRLARINVRAQKPTADPSRYTTHRGLSSEGRKPGNYYVSRETRGNPDFFFFLSPVEDFKGIILQHPGETFYAMWIFFFFAGEGYHFSCQNSRIIITRNVLSRKFKLLFERERVFFLLLFRRVEGNYPRLKIFYGFHWGWWNKKWVSEQVWESGDR